MKNRSRDGLAAKGLLMYGVIWKVLQTKFLQVLEPNVSYLKRGLGPIKEDDGSRWRMKVHV